MDIPALVMSVTGVTGITKIEVVEAYNQATVTVEVTATAHALSVGDTVSVTLGTSLDSSVVVTAGIVRKIITRKPEFNYTITIQDSLCRAIDFFIASDDPNAPYKADHIEASALVVYLLGLAGITSVDASATIFTYGTALPVPINLISVWNMVDTISRVCGFTTYVDRSGTVHFVERKPYVTTSDTAATHDYTTGDTGDILSIEYDRNTEGLINRIVVYGGVAQNVHSTASAASPYLPDGFFKTTVVGHPLIDNQAAADATAALNLEMFNRLTETVSLTVKGTSTVKARDIVSVTEAFTGLTASTLWLVYGITHTVSSAGFEQRVTLIR